MRVTAHVTFSDDEREDIGRRLGLDRPADPGELQTFVRMAARAVAERRDVIDVAGRVVVLRPGPGYEYDIEQIGRSLHDLGALGVIMLPVGDEISAKSLDEIDAMVAGIRLRSSE